MKKLFITIMIFGFNTFSVTHINLKGGYNATI